MYTIAQCHAFSLPHMAHTDTIHKVAWVGGGGGRGLMITARKAGGFFYSIVAIKCCKVSNLLLNYGALLAMQES